MPKRSQAQIPVTAEDILDTTREALLVLDSDLRVRRANRSFYDMFDVPPEQTDGQFIYELGNGQWHIPALRLLLEEILPQNTTFADFEVVHDFPSIGRKVMLLNARRIEKSRGTAILLAIEDATERRRLEDERRELETRFTSLVKNIRDHSIFTLDTQGRITSWNVEAERILGYSEKEALGQHFSIIFSQEDKQAGIPEQELREAQSKGRAEDERWHIRKNRELFWALGIVTPTTDAQGTPTGFSKILRDMTDRKRAEEALQSLNVTLDTRVQERTRELQASEERLRQAVETATQRADQMRRLADDLAETELRERRRLAMILHDHVQQALTGARLRAEILSAESKDEAVTQHLTAIIGALNESIQTARTLAVELVPGQLHERGLAVAVEWLAHQFAQKYGITISVCSDSNCSPANEQDREFLYQAIRELLLNIFKHAGVQAAEVRMTETPSGFSVEVQDRGAGFDTLTAERSPASFGLSHIRERAESLGGSLDIDSQPGQGTRVRIVIPNRDSTQP